MQLVKMPTAFVLVALLAIGLGCGSDDNDSDNKDQQADPCPHMCDQVAACPGITPQEVTDCRAECPSMRANFTAANCGPQFDATIRCGSGSEVCTDTIPASCQQAVGELIGCTVPFCLANPTATICVDEEA